MSGKLKNLIAMLIFGSIGLFVKNINLSSSEIAFLRGVIGSLFLIGMSFALRQKPSFKTIKKNSLLLILSGAAVGLNWILLFEAYKYTTISNATLSYYFAPIFVMILAPLILKEKLTLIKVGCVLAAMTGLFLILNNGGAVSGSYNHVRGILYGLAAAAFYASVVLMNKFIENLTGFETTLVQLSIAALVLLPYIVLMGPTNWAGFSISSIFLILILGIIHTGIAYFLYFTSLKELEGQTIATLSYIDPISAVIFAALFLGEHMSLIQIFGGVLILSSTFLSERFEAITRKLSRKEIKG